MKLEYYLWLHKYFIPKKGCVVGNFSLTRPALPKPSVQIYIFLQCLFRVYCLIFFLLAFISKSFHKHDITISWNREIIYDCINISYQKKSCVVGNFSLTRPPLPKPSVQIRVWWSMMMKSAGNFSQAQVFFFFCFVFFNFKSRNIYESSLNLLRKFLLTPW